MENDSIMYESYLDRPFLIALHKVQDDIFGMHVCSNLFYRFNLVDKTLHYCGRMPVFDKEESKPFTALFVMLIYISLFRFGMQIWLSTTQVKIHGQKLI